MDVTVIVIDLDIIDRPTVEARHALYTTAQRHAEDARVHIRKQHSTSVKKGGFNKFTQEFDNARLRKFLSTDLTHVPSH